jgi:carboxyl-terminal processing protease
MLPGRSHGHRPLGQSHYVVAAILGSICALLLANCDPGVPSGSGKSRDSVDSLTASPTVQSFVELTPTPTPTPAPGSTATPGMSAEAQLYLDRALDILQEHSTKRLELDWNRLRSRAQGQAGSALVPSDTYPAIESAIRSLGDGHSFFMTPEQVDELERGELTVDLPGPSGTLMENGLAYLSMPPFAGSIQADQRYAEALQAVIKELDSAAPCGWIVDLRENRGGDFWPMLAGIGPLLGEGPAGASVGSDGEKTTWSYSAGRALEGDIVQISLGDRAPYLMRGSWPAVAILTGRQTISSGEAILVAFRGRPNTRSFGQETGGLSTGNDRFDLEDGASIFLTVSKFSDRTGKVYGGIISPDVYIAGADSDPALALDAAATWLLDLPTCATSR